MEIHNIKIHKIKYEQYKVVFGEVMSILSRIMFKLTRTEQATNII